jgi:subfamily B ATP-binding cassette protein MsbA
MQLYLRLLHYVKPYWTWLIVAMICAGGVSGLTAAYAWLVKPVLDEIFIKKDTHMLFTLPFLIVGVALFKGLFAFSQSYLMQYVGSRIIMDLRKKLYHHIILLPLGFHIKHPTGLLMSRVINDVSLMQSSVSTVVKDLFQQGLTLVALLIVIFTQDWKLASLAVLALPVAYYPMVRMGRRLKRLSIKGQEKVADMTTALQETFTGIRVVKAFGKEQFEAQRFQEKNFHYFNTIMRTTRVSEIASPLMEFFGAIGVALVILYGGYHVVQGTTTPGTFSSFLAACLMTYNPIRALLRSYTAIQQAMGAAERVFTILDLETEEAKDTSKKEIVGIRQGIEFRDITFQYEGSGRPVLSGINLYVSVGESIALVGTSGSGKTTLANLVPRFYDPTHGSVLIDGIDTRNITIASLRRLIGIVSQEIVLFDDTVRNNIAYGMQDITLEDVMKAAKAAYAHDFIMKMSQGYDTMIGEQGVKLSVGERQRLSIARALLKSPPILILDEATSALDPESENIVQKALQNLMKDRTTFVIAHRLSTIEQVSRIVVLSKGNIVEIGTHEELLKNNGIYGRFYHRQFAARERHAG